MVQEYLIALEERVDQGALEFVPRHSRRDYSPQSLFDVVKGFNRKVPLACILELKSDIRPYLAAIIVDAIRNGGDCLILPNDVQSKVRWVNS